MRKYYLLLTFIAINISAQSYQEGFNTGYSSGYCYQKNGCLSPLPPMAPIQQIVVGQSDYQTGYNAGFAEGLKKNLEPIPINGGAYGQLKPVQNNVGNIIQSSINNIAENYNWDNYYQKRNSKKIYKEGKQAELKELYNQEYLSVSKMIDDLYWDLMSKYGNTEDVKNRINDFRNENNIIFDKYFKKKRLQEFYKESNILKEKILRFELDQSPK